MDKMTAVSLVEYNTPTSLRSCGSSVGSFVQNRRRLKCYSPEKKVSGLRSGRPHLSGKPDVRGRPNVTPKRPCLDGTLVASPLQSPLDQHPSSPYCQLNKWDETKFACPPSASVSSGSCDLSDDFSEEDLDKYVSHDTPDNLQVLGSKFKLHGMYDVPRLSGSKTKTPQTPAAILSPDVNEDDERGSGPSPENPPPSPVNFLPSVEGFVVGGRKVFSPVKNTSSPIPSYSARDFVPGFVKHPLYHCGKCEDKVVEEEQSLTALNKKMQHYLHSRASHHRRHDEDHMGPSWSQGLSCSQVMCFNPENFTSCLASCEAESKSFIELYQEKKRQKEEKEKEWREKQERIREGKQKDQLLKLKERLKKSEEEHTKASMSNTSSDHKKGARPGGFRNNSNPYDQSIEESGLRDLSNTDVSVTENERKILKLPLIDPNRAYNDNLRLRRCWSDIWPFQDSSSHKIDSISGENITLKCSDNKHSRGRITPFYSLPLEGHETPVIQEQCPVESPVPVSPDHSQDNTPDSVGDPAVMSESEVTLMVDETKVADPDSTMTATVIVPQKDVGCTQWVTFNGDNEPILNNSPALDDGCDTYLKRLQRSKLYSNSDPALPGNSQFCFKAVVDKRYNRWKRRRRKKKDLEFRRSSIPPTSDSSDENEDGRNMAMERIIERMYEQINGCPPQTPGGSRDTPRIRNRRRRLDKDVDREPGEYVINYDASSEWTTSDKDGALGSSSCGSCTGNPIRTTPEGLVPSQELCNWPFLEKYREEMMKRINETTEDKQYILSKNDWLPDISLPCSEPIRYEDQPEAGQSSGSLTPVEQQSPVMVRNKSGESFSLCSTPEPTSPTGQLPSASFSYSTWCRLDKPIRNSGDDDRTRSSRTRATTWGEIEANPRTAKRVSVVSVDRNELDTTFKAAIRPIKRPDIIATTVSKPIKKTRENVPHRFQSVNMPSLSKNSKSQTVPRLDRSYNTKSPKVSKKVDMSKEHMLRPKTQPQTTRTLRKTKPTYQNSVDSELIFRDYYLRSLNNRKGRINSHATSFPSGSKLKKTITVDNLDLGHRRNSTKKTEDENLSNLSFTRSFTFSMFNLPDMYKVYNNRLEQRANGQEVEDRE